MSNMIKTIKYNKASSGRIQIAFVVFVTDGDDHNNSFAIFVTIFKFNVWKYDLQGLNFST